MPLMPSPWQSLPRDERPNSDERPWAQRLPTSRLTSYQMWWHSDPAHGSPWLPVRPQMDMRGQVWHPDFLTLAPPRMIDEHGYYLGGGNDLLHGMWLKSLPPPTYAPPTSNNTLAGDSLGDLLQRLYGHSY
jgi:hypothetical protein